jgi:hypothetical protein
VKVLQEHISCGKEMTTPSPFGSAFHVSALRYAEASRPIYVGRPASSPPSNGRRPKRDLDTLFEKAEDNYRPGLSSSSSLLIRPSAATSLESEPASLRDNGYTAGAGRQNDHADEIARDGFQRTKARALLANTIPRLALGGTDYQGRSLQNPLHDSRSIYLPSRRAKNPQSRQSYEQSRNRRRLLKEKGKAKERDADSQEDEAEEELGAMDLLNDKEDAENITREMLADAEELRRYMPSSSLLKTIHYLAAHYYDARGKLYEQEAATSSTVQSSTLPGARQANAEEEDEEGDNVDTGSLPSASMLRVNEGSALVALAIFLEETAKFEMAAQNESIVDQTTKKEEDVKFIGDLVKRHKAAAKKRQRYGLEGGRLLDNGWAKIMKKKKKKTEARALAEAVEDEAISEDEM